MVRRHMVRQCVNRGVRPIKLCIDNPAAISIANNTNVSKRSKHFEVKFHYIRQEVQNRHIVTEYYPTETMLADIFTKPLNPDKFQKLRNMLGIKCVH